METLTEEKSEGGAKSEPRLAPKRRRGCQGYRHDRAVRRRRASMPWHWELDTRESTAVHQADGASKMTKKCHWIGHFRDTSGSKSDTLKERTKLTFCTVCHAREISQ